METHLSIGQPDSLDGFESLQQLVWNCSQIDIVPSHLLKAHLQHGGCLLGAWVGRELVGFVYAFPGVPASQAVPAHAKYQIPYLYSHLAAVHPDHQGKGIGRQLKLAQAQWARERGYGRIVWTFDPLQAANANLNIARLGTTCQRYLVNYYGDLDDDLNRGVPTDRFEVDWWINQNRSPRKRARQTQFSFPWPLTQESRRAWRLQSRVVFQEAFQAGLSVVDFELTENEAIYWLGVLDED